MNLNAGEFFNEPSDERSNEPAANTCGCADAQLALYGLALRGCLCLRLGYVRNDAFAALVEQVPSAVSSKVLDVRVTSLTPRRDSSALSALLMAAGEELRALAAAERL